MKSNNFGRVHRFIKIAVDCLLNIREQLFQRFCLSMNPEAQCRGAITPIYLIFFDLKNQFAHQADDTPIDRFRKAHSTQNIFGA